MPHAPHATGRWLLVGLCFFALSLAFSARAALGLAMPTWQAEFGWSRTALSLGSALALILMAMLAPLVGAAVDREGPRRVLVAGLVLVGTGSLLVSAMESLGFFYFAFSFVAALGFGSVAMHVVTTAVAQAFPERSGLPVGIATAGASGGQLLVVPILAAVQESLDWRWSFIGLGVLALALAPLAWRLAPARPRRTGPREAPGEPLGRRLMALARSGPFNILFWSFTVCGFTATGAIEVHLLPYAAFCGLPPLPSATAYGLLSAVNLGGMVLAGWLSDRMNRPLLLGSIYIFRAASFLLLMGQVDSMATLYLFAVLFGLFDYATVPVTASLVASRLGLKVMGLAMGLLAAGHALGAALGSWLGGLLYDRYADYDWLWITAFISAGGAGLAVFLLRETRGRTPVAQPA